MVSHRDVSWLEPLGFSDEDFERNESLVTFLCYYRPQVQGIADRLGPLARYVLHDGLSNWGVNELLRSETDLKEVVACLERMMRKPGVEVSVVLKSLFPFGVMEPRSLPVFQDLCSVICELSERSNPLSSLVLLEGMPIVLGFIHDVNNVRDLGMGLLGIAKAYSTDTRKVFAIFKTYLRFSGSVRSACDFRKWAPTLAELALIGGEKYSRAFFRNESFLIKYSADRAQGRHIGLNDALEMLKTVLFPGIDPALLALVGPSVVFTDDAMDVRKLLEHAREGREQFYRWYDSTNHSQLRVLVDHGVNILPWLGRRLVGFQPRRLIIGRVQLTQMRDQILPQLKLYIDLLLRSVTDANYVWSLILRRMPFREQSKSISGFVDLLGRHPNLIPGLMQDVVTAAVGRGGGPRGELNERDFRKLLSRYYGRALTRALARGEQKEAEKLVAELRLVERQTFGALLEMLRPGPNQLLAGSYVAVRVAEMYRVSPRKGFEADYDLALRGLDETASALTDLLAAEKSNDAASWEGCYDLQLRVSDKFPPEVLTIGSDGHSCIRQGGIEEDAGYRYCTDADALIVEIWAKHAKTGVLQLLTKRRRIGFVLAFAAEDQRGNAVLALNSIELPKVWPSHVQERFFDEVAEWLAEFANSVGFNAILAGNNRCVTYFSRKYGTQNVYYRKMNPTATRYYTDAFDNRRQEGSSGGAVFAYSGIGSCIWRRK